MEEDAKRNVHELICILTSVHPPFDTRIFLKEAKTLVKAGYDVTLIAQHDREEVVDGVRILPLARLKSRIERMTKTVWQAYRLARQVNADVYHFHDPELIPIGLLLKRQEKKVIYDVHEDVPRQNLSKDYIPVYVRKPISLMIEILEDFAAKRFDGVVTATPFINKRFWKLGAFALNINNYPLPAEFRPIENPGHEKERAVCYVGGIGRIRGAMEMVKAIELTGYKLLLAGEFEPGLQETLRQQPGWKYVEALGYIDREGVRATMARSMAGLVLFHPEPNHVDAQPNKMFEYMSARLPVIASNFPLWREIIEGNKCGLCADPLNPEEIAAAITWIVEHPVEAEVMGKNGRKAVEERYNWNTEGEKLLALYRQVLAG